MVRWGKGRVWLLAYLDDGASRFVPRYGMFDNTTTENAISVLDNCIKRYGRPLELLTDHGSQFYASSGQIKSPGVSRFQEYLLKNRINHILGGSVNRPQTNGKIERFYETFQLKVQSFRLDRTVCRLVQHVEKKPHMSVNWDELERLRYRRSTEKWMEEGSLLLWSVI